MSLDSTDGAGAVASHRLRLDHGRQRTTAVVRRRCCCLRTESRAITSQATTRAPGIAGVMNGR